jgi:DNA-directed RNA polymerase alpha subunit
MKIHAEFNSLAEVAAFARFAESGLNAAPPPKSQKQLDKEKAEAASWKQRYEITKNNLGRALHRLRLADPKGLTANYDATPNVSPVDDVAILKLDTRTTNCLQAENITSLTALCKKTPNDLLKLPNLGRRSLRLIEEALAARGLKLKERK